ncbi:MAG: 50S ribosomal protein L29 [Gammaproteobacteria bacterium]|nr:50S ribosomal protein L29 [Gammaproteobacteria bacterium]
MDAAELRSKSSAELDELLIEKLKEQFNLRMQSGSGQAPRPNVIRGVRRDIARIKTVMRQQQLAGDK